MSCLRLFVALAAFLSLATRLVAAEPLIRLKLGQHTLEGTPLSWDSQKIFFLARDGQLVEFPHAQAKDYGVAGSFKSISQAEIRGQLLAEYGQGYEVSGVGHYLVVHPTGQKDQWAPRFEALYRSFVQYFAARGWQLTEPKFPLVAVVYPRQVDFQRQAAKEGVPPNSGFLGYYSPTTNRILLYDVTAGRSGYDWTVNAETIIHEAAHQMAFNTGVHSRFAGTPRWVVEGLGTMFEARGVWQSGTFQTQPDRINRGMLNAYRKHLARNPGRPSSFLFPSDQAYQVVPQVAYPEGWAWSFFLCETEPKKYFTYVAKTAARPPFSRYRSQERMKDFTDVFGTDLKMLDARMQRFIAGLK
jgi:hypothetical protein